MGQKHEVGHSDVGLIGQLQITLQNPGMSRQPWEDGRFHAHSEMVDIILSDYIFASNPHLRGPCAPPPDRSRNLAPQDNLNFPRPLRRQHRVAASQMVLDVCIPTLFNPRNSIITPFPLNGKMLNGFNLTTTEI